MPWEPVPDPSGRGLRPFQVISMAPHIGTTSMFGCARPRCLSSRVAAVLVVVLCSGFTRAAEAQPPSGVPKVLPPLDEGASVAGFEQFRARLRTILRQRDVAGLRALTAPRIRPSINDEKLGFDEFLKLWKIQAPRTTFWTDTLTLIDAGSRGFGDCSSSDRCTIVAPYWGGGFEFDAINYFVAR